MTDNELLLQISKIVTANTKYLEYRIDQIDENFSNQINGLEHTVSARMDEKDDEDKEIEDEEEKVDPIMVVQEKVAREYLEEVTSFIEDMCEKDSKAKIEEKVNYIFNRERLKREKEQEEKIMAEKAKLEEFVRSEAEKSLEERQKQLGNN